MNQKFDHIKTLLTTTLDTEQGILLGVLHNDEEFHKFMAKKLLLELKTKIKFLFFEGSTTAVQKNIEFIQEEMKRKNIKSDDEKIKHIFNLCTNKKMPMIIPIACAHFLHGITVIGMDVDEAQLRKVESIFYGLSFPLEREWALQERLKHNGEMIKKIREAAQKNHKYIVLSQPMYVDIGTNLGIKKVDVFFDNDYFLIANLLSKNEQYLLKEEIKKPAIQPDYACIYDDKTMKPLTLPLLTTESVEKTRLVFRYNLENSSKTELEKGLGIAAISNIGSKTGYTFFKDVKKFVDFGADVNAKDNDPSSKKTALHYAVEKKHLESIEELLKLNADIKIPDAMGQTALSIAENNLGFFKTKNCNKIKEISMEKFPAEFKKLTEKAPECNMM